MVILEFLYSIDYEGTKVLHYSILHNRNLYNTGRTDSVSVAL